MDTEAVYWTIIGAGAVLWRIGSALYAIAEAVKVAMPREVNLRHQREREPWENN